MRPLLLAACAAAVLAGCGSSTQHVVTVSTSPWPEGPIGPVAAAKPVSGLYVPLERIAGAIPSTLPDNPPQSCTIGAIVTLTLASGRTLAYGPCNRPASIERLRIALVRAAERAHPPPPPRPVTGREWKNVIDDWYDGRIDHWHRCATVREAIRHLPTDPPAYSTVVTDLHAYAKAVCWPDLARS